MNPLTLLDLLTLPHFQLGLGLGVLGSVLAIGLRRGFQPVPLWGGLVSSAVVLAAAFLIPEWAGPAVATVLLLAGGELLNRIPPLGAPLLAAAATMLALLPMVPDALWIRTGTATFVLAGGWAIRRVDRSLGETGIPILMAAAMTFGIWGTVPETEHARILVGASTGALVLGWPKVIARIGSGGAFALAGVMAWSIVLGGAERAGSIVGAWATLGVFVAAPLIHREAAARRWPILALHVLAVVVAARVAGFQEGARSAALIAAPVLIVVLAAAYSLVKPRPELEQPAS